MIAMMTKMMKVEHAMPKWRATKIRRNGGRRIVISAIKTVVMKSEWLWQSMRMTAIRRKSCDAARAMPLQKEAKQQY